MRLHDPVLLTLISLPAPGTWETDLVACDIEYVAGMGKKISPSLISLLSQTFLHSAHFFCPPLHSLLLLSGSSRALIE